MTATKERLQKQLASINTKLLRGAAHVASVRVAMMRSEQEGRDVTQERADLELVERIQAILVSDREQLLKDWVESSSKSDSEKRVVCKSCARSFYYSFAFVLTKLQPVAAKSRPSCTACFVGAVRIVE
jgi:hypothetical protein